MPTVLNVTLTDQAGSRFNGVSLRNYLSLLGWQSRHIVGRKSSDDPLVSPFLNSRVTRALSQRIQRFESRISLQSVLNPFPFLMPLYKVFRWANVLHFHILQTWDFNLLALPLLTNLRPSIWTIHDFWALSGHCNYPLGCEQWLTNCRECTRLDIYPSLSRDTASSMYTIKKWVYGFSHMDIIVASPWMLRLAKNSVLLRSSRIHHIPFGINLTQFAPRDGREARRRLGIPQENVVLAFRAESGLFKGLSWIKQALHRVKSIRPLTLLTVEHKEILNDFLGTHQIIELGWINDDNMINDFFAAADIFLMPSDAESFGLMAVEAMASGKPVIAMEGSSLPEVILAPEVGLTFSQGNVCEFVAILERLISDENERYVRGRLARKAAEAFYDLALQAKRLAALYEDVMSRRNQSQRLMAS